MGPFRPSDEGGRNIVPISGSLLDRMCWRQALAGLVKNHARQQAWARCARARRPLHAVCGKRRLDAVPQRLVYDRFVFSWIELALIEYLAAVKTVLKDQIQRPPGERL